MEDLLTIQGRVVLSWEFFVRIGDLINIDGPLLTLFQDQADGSLYMYDWVDNDDHVNRFIIYPISAGDIVEYLNKRITHVVLFNRAFGGNHFYADIDPARLAEYEIRSLTRLPERYSNIEATYFDEEYCPDVKKILLFANRAKAARENENFFGGASTMFTAYYSHPAADQKSASKPMSKFSQIWDAELVVVVHFADPRPRRVAGKFKDWRFESNSFIENERLNPEHFHV